MLALGNVMLPGGGKGNFFLKGKQTVSSSPVWLRNLLRKH